MRVVAQSVRRNENAARTRKSGLKDVEFMGPFYMKFQDGEGIQPVPGVLVSGVWKK